jgi:hypothetical protein
MRPRRRGFVKLRVNTHQHRQVEDATVAGAFPDPDDGQDPGPVSGVLGQVNALETHLDQQGINRPRIKIDQAKHNHGDHRPAHEIRQEHQRLGHALERPVTDFIQ